MNVSLVQHVKMCLSLSRWEDNSGISSIFHRLSVGKVFSDTAWRRKAIRNFTRMHATMTKLTPKTRRLHVATIRGNIGIVAASSSASLEYYWIVSCWQSISLNLSAPPLGCRLESLFYFILSMFEMINTTVVFNWCFSENGEERLKAVAPIKSSRIRRSIDAANAFGDAQVSFSYWITHSVVPFLLWQAPSSNRISRSFKYRVSHDVYLCALSWKRYNIASFGFVYRVLHTVLC